ncbi:MAG: aminotransferase class I/II-fold pyridoxal phosphate-dependent enzyme [Desulfovibrio sp.]|jgi:threonine-phosphate decarboxylase|nr:aminotransferase class I/II-fold pyridoxal phosphate-dependent enzyme [Desulfovibrio sp.]
MTSLSDHAHGGEVYTTARRLHTTPDKLLDFSNNANIFAYQLTKKLTDATPYPFLHYPDSAAEELAGVIAAHEHVAPDRILPGNGGTELIWLTLRALEPRKVLFIGPIFSEYVRVCLAFSIPFDILTLASENEFNYSADDLSAIWESDADLIVLCTPNNPAGAIYDMARLLHMLRAPRVLIDCSYREFLYGMDDYDHNSLNSYCASARPGVSIFTLHSFTKFFCCPGIRLGYLMGDRNHLARIAALRPAWSVSPFAQVMGKRFLDSVEAYRESLTPLRQAVAHMGRELRRLACVNPEKVLEGPAFLCCGLRPRFNTKTVCKTLLNRRILVRDCDSIPGMPEGFIRMQARPESDAARLLSILDAL